MLNELLIAERGARQAGVAITQRHPDIQATAQRVSTLRVRLNEKGDVTTVVPVPEDAELWTLRNHNKNSFPFVQVKPLLNDVVVKKWQAWTKAHPRPQAHEMRAQLQTLAQDGELRRAKLGEWASNEVMRALQRRLDQVETLEGTQAAVLPAALRRFLHACDSKAGGDPLRFLEAIRTRLVTGLKTAATDAWNRCSAALLVAGKGALWIDADGDWSRSLIDTRVVSTISHALTSSQSSADAITGQCGLSGQRTRLVGDTFPRVDLPIIGPTILFSRFDQDPANARYGRFGSDTMPVAEDLVRSLAAAAKALTSRDRKGKTWRGVPGEAPKQQDLFLAFVEGTADAPLAGTLAEDAVEDDFSEESPETPSAGSESVAAFEKRTQRLVEAVQAKVGAEFRRTPVRLAVLRRLDPANRKAIYTGTPTVGDLYEAAKAWAAGERNVPPCLRLHALPEGGRKPLQMGPPHVAPLGMIAFSRQLFIRGGTEQQEVVGMPAAEALGLFLHGPENGGGAAYRRAAGVLHLVLSRRTMLMVGSAHMQNTPQCWRHRQEAIKKFDHREALRTVTVLGLLLHKLGRRKEEYMSDTAFKLGQLLAAADIVHAGYCADVRGGNVPPSLLGNQVFTMAQTAPAKALAMLSRRWKPYDGWAKKAARERDRADRLVASKDAKEQRRGWDIRKALRHAREMGPLAEKLGPALAGCEVSDTFRAELLLGYIAGLPKAQEEIAGDTDETTNT